MIRVWRWASIEKHAAPRTSPDVNIVPKLVPAESQGEHRRAELFRQWVISVVTGQFHRVL
jgi:hypothetical protein